MKGKMFLGMFALLVLSYFLYQYKGNPRGKENSKEAAEAITGIVTNSEGRPVSKATVYLLGTETKTYTNSKGEYRIQAEIGDELIVSHPGYKTKTVEVTFEREDIELISKDMQEDSPQLINE